MASLGRKVSHLKIETKQLFSTIINETESIIALFTFLKLILVEND